MNTTRKQRKDFVNHAKKQLKKGLISKKEFEEIKKQMADLGKIQHNKTQIQLLETNNSDILESELE